MSGFGDWMYHAAHIPWWTTARVTATVAAVALMGGLTTAIMAIRAFRHTQRNSHSRTRPMMSAEFKIVDKETLNLVVKNHGASIARDVLVCFTPSQPNHEMSADGYGNFGRLINERYERPVPVWVPGREMESFYWLRDDQGTNDAPRSVDGMPYLTNATISYVGDDGRRYDDKFPLDVREFSGAAMPIETTTTTSTRVIARRSTA